MSAAVKSSRARAGVEFLHAQGEALEQLAGNRRRRLEQCEEVTPVQNRDLERRFRETESYSLKEEIERYMWNRPCPECDGLRLKPESLAVTIVGRSIADVFGRGYRF